MSTHHSKCSNNIFFMFSKESRIWVGKKINTNRVAFSPQVLCLNNILKTPEATTQKYSFEVFS